MYRRVFEVPARKITVATRIGVDADVFRVFSPRANRAPCSESDIAEGSANTRGCWISLRQSDVPRDRNRDPARALGTRSLGDRLRAMTDDSPWLTVHDWVPVDEVADFMRGLDVYVLPARNLPDHQEHDAHALLQALACGVPCIATRSGIVPEISATAPGCSSSRRIHRSDGGDHRLARGRGRHDGG